MGLVDASVSEELEGLGLTEVDAFSPVSGFAETQPSHCWPFGLLDRAGGVSQVCPLISTIVADTLASRARLRSHVRRLTPSANQGFRLDRDSAS